MPRKKKFNFTQSPSDVLKRMEYKRPTTWYDLQIRCILSKHAYYKSTTWCWQTLRRLLTRAGLLDDGIQRNVTTAECRCVYYYYRVSCGAARAAGPGRPGCLVGLEHVVGRSKTSGHCGLNKLSCKNPAHRPQQQKSPTHATILFWMSNMRKLDYNLLAGN